MRLSEPQKRLLAKLYYWPDARPMPVKGNELRTARSLAHAGLAEVVETFGGQFETVRGVGNVGIDSSRWEGHGARITAAGSSEHVVRT